ncbi:DUF488 domain-containing protein, partial [Candidatus Entotheonella palauensis]|uniref:DUF488 domain-containing protein n=1 Tax=Candidatus Entotheonella palauensis TaxID=93172 RepID=UPI000B7E4465
MVSRFVYTIGHSSHLIERLIKLLSLHNISAVVDVRSHPYSRFNPQFNRENLRVALKQAEIAYVFMGNELGARPEDRSCYINGTVQYDLLSRSRLFQGGLSRIAQGARRHRITLLCAEKDPLVCHRSVLICRHLANLGIEAQHILDSGRLESHEQALLRLLDECGLGDSDLFRTRSELILEGRVPIFPVRLRAEPGAK